MPQHRPRGGRKDDAVDAGEESRHVGVVVGATIEHGLDLGALNGPVLAPGLGAQGAQAHDVAGLFAGVDGIVLPAAARSVLRHGPDPLALRAAAVALRDELVAAGE